jgi:hypothetical protein
VKRAEIVAVERNQSKIVHHGSCGDLPIGEGRCPADLGQACALQRMPLGGALLVTISNGAFLSAQPPIIGPVTRPPEGPTAEYGGYLISSVGGCRDCHGANLGGGVADPNGPPAGPSLLTVGQRWDEADFIKAIRTA